MFEIEFTESASDDLEFFERHEQVLILDEIETHLPAEPLTPTKKKKQLRPNNLSAWELRLGKFRAFYDVDEESHTLIVKAVGRKKHNKLLIRGKEYEL